MYTRYLATLEIQMQPNLTLQCFPTTCGQISFRPINPCSIESTSSCTLRHNPSSPLPHEMLHHLRGNRERLYQILIAPSNWTWKQTKGTKVSQ